MIEFRNVHKYYQTPRGRKVLLKDFSLTIPTASKVALLGRNGAGKSTMVGMISSTVPPSSGRIICSGTISWPMGFSSSFAADMTGRQNALFVARIYRVDHRLLIDFVQQFAELGNFFDMPVRSYSSGMRARLAFGMSMGLGFDWYLVDEITSVGDKAFREKSLEFFKSRLSEAGLIMVSHSLATIREYCTSGIVIEDGEANYFSDLEDAIKQHEENIDKAMLTPIEARVDDSDALFKEARQSYNQANYERAEEYLSWAISEQPNNPEWLSLLGKVKRRLGKDEEALEEFRRADKFLEDAQHLVLIAETLLALGREEEAEDSLRSALTIAPNNSHAAYILGRHLYRIDMISEAEPLLRQVVKGDPQNAKAHRILALIYTRQKNYTDALVHHAAAAELLPMNTTFLLGLARIQVTVGDITGARATYGRLLSLDPGNEEAKSFAVGE